MNKNRRTLLAALCCLIIILSTGCAALSPVKQETLEERVNKYMQAQIDGKWDRAYAYFDSSSRETISLENYINRTGKVAYKGFEIEEVMVLPSADQATVKVRIDISFMGYDFKRAPQTQNWVKEKGEWFVKAQQQSRRTVPHRAGKEEITSLYIPARSRCDSPGCRRAWDSHHAKRPLLRPSA